jgi:hypothetical protein
LKLIAVGGADLVIKPARDGWSALFWAAGSALYTASLEMIRVAAAAGRGPELLLMRDRDGTSALHRAAWRYCECFSQDRQCQSAVGRELIDLVGIRRAWRRGQSACREYCEHRQAELTGEGLCRGRQMEKLCEEMVRVDKSVMELVDKDKRTVLHIAASAGLESLCFKVLETASANMINLQDADGRTALHMATAAGPVMENVCRRMIEMFGADLLMVKMMNGRTALHLAAERGMGHLCQVMVEVGGRDLLMAQGQDTRTAYNIADNPEYISQEEVAAGGGAKGILHALEEEFRK